MREDLEKAKYLIYRYSHDWFIQLRLLASPDLEVALNLPSHNLSEQALIELLAQMFQENYLVATRRGTGLFTPSREDIKTALHEMPNSNELFYGYTSGAILEYKKLEKIYGERE